MNETKDSLNLKVAINFFDASPCGCIFADDNGRILRVNNYFCELLGWTREELEDKKKFTDLLSIGGRVYYQTTHAPLSKLQNEVRELSYKFLSKDKRRIPALVNSIRQKVDEKNKNLFADFFLPSKGSETAPEFITQFVIFPFSDRQKFENELLNAKKEAENATAAKSVFLSTMTHELRNPIHSILNAANILASEGLREDQRELADIVQFSAQGLLEVVNSVLDISKMEAGNISLTEKSFSLHRLLHKIIQSFRPQAEQKGLKLEWEISADTPLQFMGDETKIKQVLTNLIGNAVKFTAKGFVSLSVDYNQSKNELFFKVEDSGIGINPNTAKKIFLPFLQANDSIHMNFGGTGLGLSISQKILDAYNTKLEVTGEEGKGSVFSFKLKLPRAEKEILQSVQKDSEYTSLAHLKILVADDVKSNLIIVSRYFKQWNLSFDTAENGQEAIDLVLKNDYDLVFLDISMPILSGYDAAKRIRQQADEKYKKLPLFALTAFDKKDMEEQVIKSGMNGLLQKPFLKKQLYDFICEHSTVEEESTDIMEQNTEGMSVNFEAIYDLFEDDVADMKKYMRAVLNDLSKTMADFAEAEEKFDLQLYKDAIHKMMSISRMLSLEELKNVFSKQQMFLEQNNRESFKEMVPQRMRMMLEIEEKVQQEIEK